MSAPMFDGDAWQQERETQAAQTGRRRKEDRKGYLPPSAFRGPWSPVYQDHDGGWWVNDTYYGGDYSAAVEAAGARP